MPENLWPWIAVAAAGALHAANPAAGWLALALGRPARRRVLAGLLAGHLGSVVIVALAVPLSLQWGVDSAVLQWGGAALLLPLAVNHLRSGGWRALAAPMSFVAAMAHGTGWLLVPAMVPLCATGMPGAVLTASGSAGVALAVLGVHLAAMLAATVVLGNALPVVLKQLGHVRFMCVARTIGRDGKTEPGAPGVAARPSRTADRASGTGEARCHGRGP